MITDELRANNGHATAIAGAPPTITLSSGETVGLRRQPADVMPKAHAAAQKDLADSKPSPPTQAVETEPGVFRDIANEHDPAYQAALAAWKATVASRTSQKLLLIMERLALTFTIDQTRLAELRATYADVGMDLPSDDRAAYLAYVIAPTHEDQARLFEEVYGRGLPQEAQVALHRAMFPGDLAGHAAGPIADQEGTAGV